MTVILTAAGPLGVVMVADSAITYYASDGSVSHVDEKGWLKLLRVPSARAGISYWGHVGAIRLRFDQWLEYLVRKHSQIKNVRMFADTIAHEMNTAIGGVPLSNPAGVHVAGLITDGSGYFSSVIYHIHNGHGHFRADPSTGRWGWNRTEPSKLFAVHQDFPNPETSTAWMVRNGEYFLFSHVWDALECAIGQINRLDGIRIPSQNTLGACKGYCHTMVKMIVDVYRISNLHRSVGGKVVSLAIGPDGYI